MLRWLIETAIGNPWRLYKDALKSYPDRFHARIAFLFAIVMLASPYIIYMSQAQAEQEALQCITFQGCPADYTLVGVWLIVVPISGMVLANWKLVMKPALERKRRMRDGTNGRTSR